MTLGEKIKTLRTDQGLSQSGLADKIGTVTNKAVSNWEKDINTPDTKTLIAIAGLLGVAPGYLMGYDDAPAEITAPGFTKEIPIGCIHPTGENFYSMSELKELAASIEEMGLLHNIVVYEHTPGGYKIISGERRYRACKMLHDEDGKSFATIPCRVDAAVSHDETMLKLIYANATARELSDFEKSSQAKRIKDHLTYLKNAGHKFKGRMREIVAEKLNVSPAQVGRMESINKHLIPEFMAEFQAGNFGMTAAYELSTQKPKDQRTAFEHYKETGVIIKHDPTPPPTKENRTLAEMQAAVHAVDNKAPAEWQAQKERDTQAAVDIENMTQTEVQATLRAEAEKPRAYVTLTDKDKTVTEYSGNLAMIAAVDTKDDIFTGVFSRADNVTALDYATLAKAVCRECLDRIGNDETAKDIMRVGIAGLFTAGQE